MVANCLKTLVDDVAARVHRMQELAPLQFRISHKLVFLLPYHVPPGVPKSYRILADHGGVPFSTLHLLCSRTTLNRTDKRLASHDQEMSESCKRSEAHMFGEITTSSPKDMVLSYPQNGEKARFSDRS